MIGESGRLDDQWKGGAHQRGRHDEQGECHRQPHQRETANRVRQHRVERDVCPLHQSEQDRSAERGDADEHLGDTEPQWRPPHSVVSRVRRTRLPIARPAMKLAHTALAA